MVDYYVTCNNEMENFEITNCAVTIVIMGRRKIFGIKLDETKSRKQTSLYIYIYKDVK